MLHLSPETLGFSMGLITLGFFVGTFISARISARYALTTMMIAGRLVSCLGPLVGLVLFGFGVLNVYTLFGAVMVTGFGNGLTVPSAGVGALSVRPQLAGSASCLSGALTVGGGAIVSSATGAVVGGDWAAYILLAVMLASAFMGLLAALYVLRIDRREGVVTG